MAAMSGVDGRSFQLDSSPTYTNVGALGNQSGVGAMLNLNKVAPLFYIAAAGTILWWVWKKWS